MPPAARKQQLVFGNAGINSLLCIAQTGLVSRCAFPCQPTLHFIHWCSTLSPRHPAAARADADHASRRTHDRSPVPLAALPPGVRPTCSAASSPVRPRPSRRRHSCCLRHSGAIRWCSRSPACSGCSWAAGTIAPGLPLAAAEHVDFRFYTW